VFESDVGAPLCDRSSIDEPLGNGVSGTFGFELMSGDGIIDPGDDAVGSGASRNDLSLFEGEFGDLAGNLAGELETVCRRGPCRVDLFQGHRMVEGTPGERPVIPENSGREAEKQEKKTRYHFSNSRARVGKRVERRFASEDIPSPPRVNRKEGGYRRAAGAESRYGGRKMRNPRPTEREPGPPSGNRLLLDPRR